ncbi:LysR family transcriptional regulator [Mediterraneibacter sp. NSJ-55]|uniref:LysR family transcriptional regulator n=1 Tax=Mediterraneibacter hominis TaxID=2763054 RepID=A0A923RPC8_9FIRM|nr:LysR family transcriptional regulator [Mediterraneibacter hominis]MBC5688379.1 LysR family transcriptional regulator [Mediterraneibacter hominis]
MNFLNLKYFITIAEEQSISGAARKLFVSQQSLSEHLKKMENEIGVPLFKRNSPLSLTVAGECFFEGAKELLSAYDRMLANIDNVTAKRRSKITIGIATYSIPPFLPELLARFSSKYPQYDVSVIKRQHTDISHSMRGVDLYISYLPLDESLEHVFLLEHDPYSVLFRKDLAERVYGNQWNILEEKLLKTCDLSLLKEMPFCVLKDRQGQIARDLNSIFEQYRLTPKIGFLSESGDLNAEMCLSGSGCLLAPTDFIRRRFFFNRSQDFAELLCYRIQVTGFRPCLAISYERGKHLHSAEICFIKEARAFFTETIDK